MTGVTICFHHAWPERAIDPGSGASWSLAVWRSTSCRRLHFNSTH